MKRRITRAALGLAAGWSLSVGLAVLVDQLHPAARYHGWTHYDGLMGTVPVMAMMVLFLAGQALHLSGRKRTRR